MNAVTLEKLQWLGGFILKNNYALEVQLPFLVEDKILKQHFPHQYISHVVWISKKGETRAFTKANHLTIRTIRELPGEGTTLIGARYESFWTNQNK